MQEFLVFRLYAPIASWGQAAVGGVRSTTVNPTRSALIGLLGAALGILREELDKQEALQKSVLIAVKQLTPTSLLRDYHTTQVPSQGKQLLSTRKMELGMNGLNTILSIRDYRCDGHWVVAITLNSTAKYNLKELQDALVKPKYHLYLGRKSCSLAAPMMPIIIKTETLKEALDTEFPSLTSSLKQDSFLLGKIKMVSYFWEGEADGLGIDTEQIMLTQPWDEPINRKRWQFKQRKQYQWSQLEGC